MMARNQLFYTIALSMVKNIGPVNAKKMIEKFGSAEIIFNNLPFIRSKLKLSSKLLGELRNPQILENAEKELIFMERNKVHALTYWDEHYPFRLKQCYDAPIVLYSKGNANLNTKKVLCIVGTRTASQYGMEVCKDIVRDLKDLDLLIISGLAYGIDSAAHRNALDHGLSTVAVVGHGLNYIYPQANSNLAKKILSNGSIISDFSTSSAIVPGNFISRNRIIAGLSDACLVVESKYKGGSLITANLANSYNRDVFAIPGKPKDSLHQGPNRLIKENKAALIENAQDIIKIMSWGKPIRKKMLQLDLFEGLNDSEKQIINAIKNEEPVHIDKICKIVKSNIPTISPLLLNLELKNMIKSRPGNSYILHP